VSPFSTQIANLSEKDVVIVVVQLSGVSLNCGYQRAYCSSPHYIYISMERHGGMILTGEIEELGQKPVPVPLCSQIPHGLTRARTLASAMIGRRLTAWAMERPSEKHTVPILRSEILNNETLCLLTLSHGVTAQMSRCCTVVRTSDLTPTATILFHAVIIIHSQLTKTLRNLWSWKSAVKWDDKRI
jgi:hypothetical protein